MLQDPFKYVENHVHTVGGSFKKFCSGVVQDFLPVSVDPVKCEAKAVVPEDAVVSPFTYNNDSAVSFVEISSDATVRKSPVVIDGIDLEEKQLGHASGHHNPDQPKNAKSSETHETSDCVLATSKISVLTNGDSGLCDDQNTIKESTGGPMELAFPCATEYFEASSPDELIETNHDNECVVSEIDPIDHAEKQLDHVSAGHHNACQFKTAEAANIYETSGSVLVPVLTNGKSDLTSFVNAIKEAADEPAELTFLGLTESFEASTLDESVETDHENDCVLLPIDAIDHVEKWQIDDDLLSTGHHNADQLRNAKSIYDNESSDSVLAPSMKINALTYINSDLSNVNPIKDSPDGLLELTSPSVSVTEFSDASSFDKLTESNHENECVVSAKFASATSVQSLKIERITGAFCDSFADDAECSFGASSIPSETAPSAVSRDNTITGTGLVSSTSSRLIPSISLPGYSSDILFTGAMFCHNPGDSAGCVSDSPRVLLSSTPDSIMSFKDKALEKQLVSSSSLRSLESTGMLLNSYVRTVFSSSLLFLFVYQ